MTLQLQCNVQPFYLKGENIDLLHNTFMEPGVSPSDLRPHGNFLSAMASDGNSQVWISPTNFVKLQRNVVEDD